jgi:hypothetical protein
MACTSTITRCLRGFDPRQRMGTMKEETKKSLDKLSAGIQQCIVVVD